MAIDPLYFDVQGIIFPNYEGNPFDVSRIIFPIDSGIPVVVPFNPVDVIGSYDPQPFNVMGDFDPYLNVEGSTLSYTNDEIKKVRGGTFTFLYTQVDGFTDDMSSWDFLFELVPFGSGCNGCSTDPVFSITDQSRFTETDSPENLQWQLTRDDQLDTPIPKGAYSWRLWRIDTGFEELLADGPFLLK